MTATIHTPWGETVRGQIRCWMGRRWVEVEDSEGRRHIGRLTPEPDRHRVSTVDRAAVAAC